MVLEPGATPVTRASGLIVATDGTVLDQVAAPPFVLSSTAPVQL